MNDTLLKAERLSKTKGLKGWAATLAILALMCLDQFVVNVPYANVVFPILIICAASMSFCKNFALIALYAVLFELSCLAWFPARLSTAKWWLLQVFVGYFMPYLVYKAFNPKHENVSVFTYALYASVGEILYFWTSVVATVILWKIPFFTYLLNDAVEEFKAAAITFICALPVALIYKLLTGEIKLPQRKRLKNEQEKAV